MIMKMEYFNNVDEDEDNEDDATFKGDRVNSAGFHFNPVPNNIDFDDDSEDCLHRY